MRRETDIVTLTCSLDVRERLLLDEMKQRTGLATDANLVRTALHFYAQHLEIVGLQVHDFGLRDPGRGTRVRRPRQPPCTPPAKAGLA